MIVTKVEDQGDTGHKYEITVHPGNVLYCTCPAWKFSSKPASQRSCKHIVFAATTLST